jgi:sugar phosphate isomerase/epimerase
VKLMICMRGEPEQLPFLAEIAELGAGIELGSYGMIGVQSEQDWETRFTLHEAIRTQFQGLIAIHGPFLGMEYTHIDHLIREVVNRRLDMTFDVAVKLKASRVILHSGYKPEIDIFKLQDTWLNKSIEFWQQEIRRWANAGIMIVLENDTEKSPDLLVRLVNEVNSPSLGLCMDIGHQHVFSELEAPEWVRRMGNWLFHIHLHDNDGIDDTHWAIGRGTIDFELFYAAIQQHGPQATISLEVEDTMEVKMNDLRKLVAYFASKQQPSSCANHP